MVTEFVFCVHIMKRLVGAAIDVRQVTDWWVGNFLCGWDDEDCSDPGDVIGATEHAQV